jgi:hypothetical protein
MTQSRPKCSGTIISRIGFGEVLILSALHRMRSTHPGNPPLSKHPEVDKLASGLPWPS